VGSPVLEVGGAAADAAIQDATIPDTTIPGATIQDATIQDATSQDATEKDAYRAEERAGSGNVLIGYGTTERAASGRRRPRPLATPASTPPTSPSRTRDLPQNTASPRQEPGNSATARAGD